MLLRIQRIGVCGSDIHVFHGKHPYTSYPVVQGHEFSALVEAVGPGVAGIAPGDKVTAMPQVVCGRCPPCRRGDYHICDRLKVQGFQAPGCAQELWVTAADKIVPLPDGFSFEQGALVEPARLYLLPEAAEPGQPTRAVLAWHAWLSDTAAGVSNAYFVDAATGRLVYALPRSAHAKKRTIYDAQMLTDIDVLPKRREGDKPSGIADVDEAYDNLGHVYDYYWAKHGRDSYNGTGGELRAVVRLREDPDEKWFNASFVPGDIDTMLYGEEMTKLDVTGHELTHGVTFNSADLWYMYQSGALNESFSDIFGEAVEHFARGRNDWLVGDEIPNSPPFRSMSNPPAYGDPGHYNDFYAGCGDWGGVHINSGIQNKAFYLMATKIGIEKAAQVAYRTLTTYLGPRSRFTDSRIGFIESANKLYGKNSTETKEVTAAWNAVGVDGVFEQPRQDCPCIADDSLSGTGLGGLDPQGPGVDAVLASLLHVRDLFSNGRTPALRHYEVVYVTYSKRAIELMGADDELRRRTAHAMQTLEPALRTVGTTAGDSTRLTSAMLTEVEALLHSYAEADRAAGGGGLADRIDDELGKAGLASLVGQTSTRPSRSSTSASGDGDAACACDCGRTTAPWADGGAGGGRAATGTGAGQADRGRAGGGGRWAPGGPVRGVDRARRPVRCAEATDPRAAHRVRPAAADRGGRPQPGRRAGAVAPAGSAIPATVDCQRGACEGRGRGTRRRAGRPAGGARRPHRADVRAAEDQAGHGRRRGGHRGVERRPNRRGPDLVELRHPG